MITASLLDDELFLLSFLFVKLICRQSHFDRFKEKELVILIFYSQISELIVELISSSGSGWEYNIYCWNPLLFVFNELNITLMPQLIWLINSIVFYFIALKLKGKLSNNS
ncbi:MAG: hypothetical protein ACFFAH_02450 [Promethearchaeota archaeon]